MFIFNKLCLGAVSVLFISILCGCSVDKAPLERVFRCNARGGNTCGTNAAGNQMACFAGSSIGSADYCAEPCAIGMSTEGGSLCLPGGALAKACHPSLDDCPTGFVCLRTDLLSDEGVCLLNDVAVGRTGSVVCSRDEECTAVADRGTCGTTLARQIYGADAKMSFDHLYCVQSQCNALGSSCAQGEVCLPKIIPASSRPPDICVPQCDRNFGCPPNSFCLREVSGPGSVSVCLPGLVGFRCTSDMDCMLGSCVESGAGYKLCTQACQSDSECAVFDGNRGPYFCTLDPDGMNKHCRNAIAFAGALCTSDDQCPSHLVCQKHFPLRHPMNGTGECRPPCSADGRCEARGGIPHICLEGDGKRACYPGHFGVPCSTTDECVPGLVCEMTEALTNEGERLAKPICTIACTTDKECTGRLTISGYCRANQCLPRVGPGWQCSEDKHCSFGTCAASTIAADPPGTRRCL